jgi:hypothetical protein
VYWANDFKPRALIKKTGVGFKAGLKVSDTCHLAKGNSEQNSPSSKIMIR